MAYDRPMLRKLTPGRRGRAGRMLPALLVALLPAGLALALEAPPPAQGIAEPPRSTADRTVDKIIQKIEEKHAAKVVKKDERTEKGRKVLVLRLLSDEGRVWQVKVDVESGKEL